MALFKPELVNIPSFLTILECDICGVRFSSSMKSAWPLCTVGIPHKKIESSEQMEWREKIIKTGDFPRLDFIRPVLELKSYKNTCSWIEESLPSVPPSYDVRVPKENFRRFRDMYFIQGYFIGNVVEKYNWSLIDLMNYAMKHWKDISCTNP